MSDRVTLLVEFEIRPGRLDDFKAAVHALRSVVGEQEPGTLTYEWWLSEDARRGASIEIFADSDALVRHMGGDPTLSAKLTDAAAVASLKVLGELTVAARASIEAAATGFYSRLGGIER